MDYKKKYLKYKKKYLATKNIIKNRITKEIRNNPNIKNKLKGGMSGDILNWIVPIVLSALGVSAGYLGYKYFKKRNEGEKKEGELVESLVVQEGKPEEPVVVQPEEPVVVQPEEPVVVQPEEPVVEPKTPAVEDVSEEEPELERTYTAEEVNEYGVEPGPGGSRAAEKMEKQNTMTPDEFDKKRGFEDADLITEKQILKQIQEEDKQIQEEEKKQRQNEERDRRNKERDRRIEEQDRRSVSGYY